MKSLTAWLASFRIYPLAVATIGYPSVRREGDILHHHLPAYARLSSQRSAGQGMRGLPHQCQNLLRLCVPVRALSVPAALSSLLFNLIPIPAFLSFPVYTLPLFTAVSNNSRHIVTTCRKDNGRNQRRFKISIPILIHCRRPCNYKHRISAGTSIRALLFTRKQNAACCKQKRLCRILPCKASLEPSPTARRCFQADVQNWGRMSQSAA